MIDYTIIILEDGNMAQRTVCLCDGKYVGIETIFTVINGQQINIPRKLKELRTKSQNNELFCSCGCGANLILVAGDRNLRKQHFRLKHGTCKNECHVVTEGKTAIDSRIVLKCWLDEKLGTDDIETRVPINFIGDTDRKYEFSFLSRGKKIAVSYCRERVNLSDEKFEIMKANSNGIQIIYIVDVMNRGNNGQYPEALMKVQDRQGYCLFLNVENISYSDAMMYAIFYAQDNDGLWKEIEIATGRLCDYVIADNRQILYKDKSLLTLLEEQTAALQESMQAERIWHEQQKRHYEETEKRRERILEEERKRRGKIGAEHQEEMKRCDEDFKRNMEANFSQQQTQVRDAEGNRWIKCEFCGRIAKESKFILYGGPNHVNLGICKACSLKQASERESMVVT